MEVMKGNDIIEKLQVSRGQISNGKVACTVLSSISQAEKLKSVLAGTDRQGYAGRTSAPMMCCWGSCNWALL